MYWETNITYQKYGTFLLQLQIALFILVENKEFPCYILYIINVINITVLLLLYIFDLSYVKYK